MKQIIFLLGLLMTWECLPAQIKPIELDKSTMDISYYPSDFPILKLKGQVTGDPLARIIYSRPQKKGRDIFGEEVKFNEVWRLGANEATEIELFKSGVFGNKKIARGRYTLYFIPTETKWTIIFSSDNYSWGSFAYKSDKDVARIEVPVQKNKDITEALAMYFENNKLVILWDYLKVEVPVKF